jgi:hypothetical protein
MLHVVGGRTFAAVERACHCGMSIDASSPSAPRADVSKLRREGRACRVVRGAATRGIDTVAACMPGFEAAGSV